MMGVASGEFRNNCSDAASSVWVCLFLFVLVFAGVVVGVGLWHFSYAHFSFSATPISAGILATPQSLAGPATPLKILSVQWYSSKGWSRPMLPDHGELAASEQAQMDAARARRGWRPISRALTSQFEKRTHRRRKSRAERRHASPPAPPRSRRTSPHAPPLTSAA